MNITESTKNTITKLCRRMLHSELKNVATQTDVDSLSISMLEIQPKGPVPDNTSTPNKRRVKKAGLSPTYPIFPSFIETRCTNPSKVEFSGNDSLMTEDEDIKQSDSSKFLGFDEINRILIEEDSRNVLTCEEINELLSILNSVP